MESLIMYYYDLLSRKVKMNISKENYEKSIKLITNYLSRYTFSYADPLWDPNNNCYNIPIVINGDFCAVVRLNSESISVSINREFLDIGLKLTETLIVNDNKYEGNFISYVPNLSITDIVVDGEEQNHIGAVVSTRFNNKGIVNLGNNELIPYDFPDDFDHLEEALNYHILAIQEQYDRFVAFDDLNIVSLKIKTK
jgi:hypothetical protein